MATRRVKKKLKKSAGQMVFKWISGALMIAGIIFFGSKIKGELSTTFSLKASLAESQKQLQQLEDEKESLLEEKDKLNDENYVAGVARAKYLITKDNEQIFTFPTLDD